MHYDWQLGVRSNASFCFVGAASLVQVIPGEGLRIRRMLRDVRLLSEHFIFSNETILLLNEKVIPLKKATTIYERRSHFERNEQV